APACIRASCGASTSRRSAEHVGGRGWKKTGLTAGGRQALPGKEKPARQLTNMWQHPTDDDRPTHRSEASDEA
ncbi:MAG: hypothetical protein Q7U11_12970, partial [Phenylobacterium sp.]|nr:hypothetical protein [Phenylobacterium sp.]